VGNGAPTRGERHFRPQLALESAVRTPCNGRAALSYEPMVRERREGVCEAGVVRTVGVDLAAQAKHTAIAVVDWAAGSARLAGVEIPADDDAVLRAAMGADKVGIDCPLGWPEPFVEFLIAQRLGAPKVVPEWRSLAFRRTDEHVRTVTGLTPLSVSTDRIGLTAMRAARLEGRLAGCGHDVRRDGAGLVVEVYPAAGLKLWRLSHNRYKGRANAVALGALVDALLGAAPWLEVGENERTCRLSDHVFDALVAALLARAAAQGSTVAPTNRDRDAAAAEGWIALPTGPLAGLAS
jgi:predicted nuclease with RNAse H fold